MITHTWIIENLECSPLIAGFENVVRKVHWVLNSSNESMLTSTNGITDLGFNPETIGFLDYNSLNEVTVLGWLFNELTQEAVTGFEQAHEKIINDTPAPEIINIPLPWATN